MDDPKHPERIASKTWRQYEPRDRLRYRLGRDAWVLKTYLQYRRLGARFGIMLHSTERQVLKKDRYGNVEPIDRIFMNPEYHFRSRRLPKLLESYERPFYKKFDETYEKRHHDESHKFLKHYYLPSDFDTPHSNVLVLEFFNNPKGINKDTAEAMLRHFLNYMVRVA